MDQFEGHALSAAGARCQEACQLDEQTSRPEESASDCLTSMAISMHEWSCRGG